MNKPKQKKTAPQTGLEDLALTRWSQIAARVRAHAFEKDRLANKLFGLYRKHWGTETEYKIDEFIDGLPVWEEEDTIKVLFTSCIGQSHQHDVLMSALDILALTEEKDGVNGIRLLEMMLYQEEHHVVLTVDCPQCLEAREEILRRLKQEARENTG